MNALFARSRRVVLVVGAVSSASFIFSPRAKADGGTMLSEPALFARCYSHITGRPVPFKHYLAGQVRAGNIKAIDACFTVLDHAKLGTNGQVASPDDQEAVSVLNQFYNFHRTLFPTNTQEQIPHYSPEYANGTNDAFDFTEGALAMTKVMFGAHKYSDLLTSLGGVRGIRVQDAGEAAMYGWDPNVKAPSRRFYGNNGDLNKNLFGTRGRAEAYTFKPTDPGFTTTFTPLPVVQIGRLIGIKDHTDSGPMSNFALQPFSNNRADLNPNIDLPFDVVKSNGGGVLGYPSYLMAYIGHPDGIVMNGALKVPRKWAIQSLRTFLCANMPDLRASDVNDFLITPDKATPQTAPFRQQTSCIGCHATQDQMAYTARNFALAFSDATNVNVSGVRDTGLIVRFKAPNDSVAGWPSEPVQGFETQKPIGRFYFRSVTGALYDQPVSNIGGLGAAMADSDDYYQCAAKHYFEMLTGNSVPLFDRGNPVNSDLLKSLTDDQVNQRKFIEQLGAQLRKDQSVLGLVKSILASDYFRTVSYRP